ncbi:MAG: hypothetical protein EAZ09_02385 [Oscillatoriales cyanobacterium]|nr:MAG: hypothetical protein EAZ18_15835 [Oscillatoriales cyanobacterium]TAH25302.1 MAG: hypothetical protein EAZ09_02385 [Oscillatoriales cyanobacterium]
MLAKQFWTLRLAAPRCVVRPIYSGLAKNYQKYGGSARSVIGLSKIGKLNILNAISQQLQPQRDRLVRSVSNSQSLWQQGF